MKRYVLFVGVLLAFALPAAPAQASIVPFCDLRDACHSVVPHLDTHLDAADIIDALEHHNSRNDTHSGHDHRDSSTHDSAPRPRGVPVNEVAGSFCQKSDGERHWWTYRGRQYWHDHHFNGHTGRTHLAGVWALYDRFVCKGGLN